MYTYFYIWNIACMSTKMNNMCISLNITCEFHIMLAYSFVSFYYLSYIKYFPVLKSL